MKRAEQYRFVQALRPFSLVVAVVSAGLGVLLAWQDGYQYYWQGALVLVGAICAQAGINLFNDLEDLPGLPKHESELRSLIVRNAQIAVFLFLMALLVGLFFTWLRGWLVLAFVLLVALFALSYNLGPINFKGRGLALPQVFVLMGVCLVEGAYLALSGHFSVDVLFLSLPISVLVSVLLLSNELRDWEADTADGIKTLSVRIGYASAVVLYIALIALAYLMAVLLLGHDQWYLCGYLLLPAPLLPPIFRQLKAHERTALTPMTGRFFFLFGLGWMAALSH